MGPSVGWNRPLMAGAVLALIVLKGLQEELNQAVA